MNAKLEYTRITLLGITRVKTEQDKKWADDIKKRILITKQQSDRQQKLEKEKKSEVEKAKKDRHIEGGHLGNPEFVKK